MPRPTPLILLLAILLPTTATCGSPTERPILLRVSAAASLSDVFGELARGYEESRGDVRVELNLGGSTRLGTQILEGAPVDVFASAGRAAMDRVARAGGVAGEPRLFGHNHLVLAVPAGNPAGVRGLPDLAREELLVGLCAPTVPCGVLARRVLDRTGITPVPDTEEPDVRRLLTKLELGELDVGLVYATDVRVAGEAVEVLPVPETRTSTNDYLVAVVEGTDHPEVAWDFVAWVESPEAREALRRHGFSTP